MDLVLQGFLIAASLFIAAGAVCIVVIMFLTGRYILRDTPENRGSACRWRTMDLESYNTGCGHEFHNATEGSPVTDWAKHCPYCGHIIKE